MFVCFKNDVYNRSIKSAAPSRLAFFRVPSRFYNQRSLSFNKGVHSARPTPPCEIAKSLLVLLGFLDRVSFGFVKLQTVLGMSTKHPWYFWHKGGPFQKQPGSGVWLVSKHCSTQNGEEKHEKEMKARGRPRLHYVGEISMLALFSVFSHILQNLNSPKIYT